MIPLNQLIMISLFSFRVGMVLHGFTQECFVSSLIGIKTEGMVFKYPRCIIHFYIHSSQMT